MLTAVTGVLLFFHAATGLNKEIHEWVGWIFLIGGILHLVLNFSTFKKYLGQRKGQVMIGASVLLLAVNFAPIGSDGAPPFVLPVQALAQAPLTTLAQVAQTSPEQLRERLTAAGLAVASDQQSVSDLVGDDFGAQMHLLEDLLADEH